MKEPKLTNHQELKNSGWKFLKDTKPPQEVFCEWVFAGDTYTEQGSGMYRTYVDTGLFGSNDLSISGFCDYKGVFVSDPTRTYWKQVEQ